MRFVILLVLLQNIQNVNAIWWWFSGDTATKYDNNDDEVKSDSTEISQVFAPFEITNVEEKFLNEAKNYLQNLPMLDQCNMLIINRLKSSCSQLSDEQLSKLSVNLLNCQSAVEGRKTYPCTDDMELSQCTGPMDPDTWNSYHIISNRARAICYNMRQTQFRMKTEQTVNKLASSALDNINILKQLSAGQQKMQEATEEGILKISKDQDQLLSNQKDLHSKQAQIGQALNNNMNDLLREKRLISLRHKQVEEYTQMINAQLASLVDEIKAQDDAKKEGEKEILKDLNSVKIKAEEVMKRLGDAFEDMDTFHDSLEGKQNKTLKNLEEIQETVLFMNQMLQKLYTSFHEQLPWLHHMFGGTMDKLTLLSLIVTHAGFFMASFFIILFLNAPNLTRVLLLILVPGNCFAILNNFQCNLTYLEMSWILTASFPVYYLIKALHRLYMRFLHPTKSVVAQINNTSPMKFSFDSPPPAIQQHNELEKIDLLNTMLTPIQKNEKHFEGVEMVSPIRNLQFPEIAMTTTSVGSQLHHYGDTNPNQDQHNASFCSKLNFTPGGSMKCKAKTKTGSRCRKSAMGCTDTCHMHTPRKDD